MPSIFSRKTVDEMLPGLLALGDDVDPGVFLQLDRDQRGVALGARELLARRFPGRP